MRCGAKCFEVQLNIKSTSNTEIVKARTPAEARKIIRSTNNKSDVDIISVTEAKRNQ